MTFSPVSGCEFRIAIVGRVCALLRIALERNGNVYHGGLIPNLTSVTDCLILPFDVLKDQVARNPILDPARPFDPVAWAGAPGGRIGAMPKESASDQLAGACDFLEHYHTDHTSDTITRLKGTKTDIYIVSDPTWRRKLLEFTKYECPPK